MLNRPKIANPRKLLKSGNPIQSLPGRPQNQKVDGGPARRISWSFQDPYVAAPHACVKLRALVDSSCAGNFTSLRSRPSPSPGSLCEHLRAHMCTRALLIKNDRKEALLFGSNTSLLIGGSSSLRILIESGSGQMRLPRTRHRSIHFQRCQGKHRFKCQIRTSEKVLQLLLACDPKLAHVLKLKLNDLQQLLHE